MEHPHQHDLRHAAHPVLQRELRLLGATMMGLGSIVGTGVFVSIGVAAEVAGPTVIMAVVLAAFVATFNALNSAQLAASHPVSGGAYEYGYKYLSPSLGFAAGWMFLCAKTASAATASLGFAGYLLTLLGHTEPDRRLVISVAALAVASLTAVVLVGVRLSNRVNMVVVSVAVSTLGLFVIAGMSNVMAEGGPAPQSFAGAVAERHSWPSFLQATALMFVAYTGYGRIATLGEEVHEPRKTIPRAIVLTLWIAGFLYTAVAVVLIAAGGAGEIGMNGSSNGAPLELAARRIAGPWLAHLVAIGAMTAMLGVLLNLILGLSRVMLAMGRRGDMPADVSRLNARKSTPYVAVLAVGMIILGLTLIGNFRATWSFSAFTVLIYYAITNAAALRLPANDRRYGRWLAWSGLLACLFLAFWVERHIWMAGVAVLLAGMAWHLAASAFHRRSATKMH